MSRDADLEALLLQRDVERFLHRQRPALERFGQVLARHELQREEVHVAFLVDAVDARHVRMVERGERLRLTLEPA